MRISVRGTSGSGKTTFARAIAAKTGIPAIDLDDLHWIPDWQTRDPETYFAMLEEATEPDHWVISGNYASQGGHKVLARATHLVWLDYSLPIVLGRVLKRTARRNFLREPCCNGNYESLSRTFSRESIIWWCITTHRRRHHQCLEAMADPAIQHLTRHCFSTPREAEAWLSSLESQTLEPQTLEP
jgi:adenylate kinase family enzyme